MVVSLLNDEESYLASLANGYCSVLALYIFFFFFLNPIKKLSLEIV